MKKIILSRSNYIHINKNENITIGVKGTQKITFDKAAILKSLSNISRWSKQLSLSLTKNNLFPDFLGLQTNIFTDKLRWTIADLYSGKTKGFDAKKVRAQLQDLIIAGKRKANFERRFYKRLGEEYKIRGGPRDRYDNIRWQYVKALAKKGALKARKGTNKKQYVTSDPTPYQEWVIDKFDLNEKQANRVKNWRFDKLNDAAQIYEEYKTDEDKMKSEFIQEFNL